MENSQKKGLGDAPITGEEKLCPSCHNHFSDDFCMAMDTTEIPI